MRTHMQRYYPNPSIKAHSAWLWLLHIATCCILLGCRDQADVPPPLPSETAMTTTATPAQSAPEPEIQNEQTNDQLVIWLPTFTGIATEGSAGTILANAFHQFEQRHPGVQLDVQAKADIGTSSLYNFLRSAQQVAPSILPDVVLINTQQLWQIVDLGLVTGLREEELFDAVNFYAVANDSVAYRSQIVGIPYALDVTHLVYDSEFNDTAPKTWADLFNAEKPFLFPAAEIGTTNATLLNYLGAGGVLMADGGISSPEAIEEFFNLVSRAHQQEIITTQLLDLSGYNATWRAFSASRNNFALTQVNQFYPNITSGRPTSYATPPTNNGHTVTIADSWAFALLTSDPQRRQLALTLINNLLEPEVQGAWSQAVARLPSQPTALSQWTSMNGYRTFLETLLSTAVYPPNGPAFTAFARRLHVAQAGIIRNELSVEDAIEAMISVEQ